MNHTVVTYLGFVVAVLIITWAAVELSRRYSRTHRRSLGQRNAASTPNQWVTLKPRSTTNDASPMGEREEVEDVEDTLDVPTSDPQLRSKQNGHYSQSKHPL